MSWLSKALKNNTVKLGVVLAGAYLGKEYFYGQTGFKGTDPSNPFDFSGVYDSSCNLMKETYVGDNFAGKALGFLNVPAFGNTAVGKSFVGDAIEFMRPGEGPGGRLLGALTDKLGQANRPPEPGLMDVGGYGVSGSAAGIGAGQAQLINVGRGGAVNSALGRDTTQQYLARKVAGLGLPRASSLPTPMSTSDRIQTTSMRSRGYAKLGLTKS